MIITGVFTLQVLGFSNVEVKDPQSALRRLRSLLQTHEVQLLRADRIAGDEHLKIVASNVARAMVHGRRRSKSLAMEVLLFTSGQGQITEAIQRIGITRDTRELLAILVSTQGASFDERNIEKSCTEVLGGVRDDSVIELRTEKKMEELCNAYGISRKELTAASLPDESEESVVKRLVLERSALLSIE